MQTLKDQFNYQARQTYLDFLVLWWLLILLIGQYRRLQNERAAGHKPAPTLRLG